MQDPARRITEDGLAHTLPREEAPPPRNGHEACKSCGRFASEFHLGPEGRRWAVALPMDASGYREGQKWTCRLCKRGVTAGHEMPD